MDDITGDILCQTGRGLGQPVLVESVPAHGRGLDLGGFEGLFQPKPFYGSVCDSMKTGLASQDKKK